METSDLVPPEKQKTTQRPAVLYVLPEYNTRTDTHFYHLYQLLEILAEYFDIHLLVERGVKPSNGKFADTYLLPSQGKFLSLRRTLSTIKFAWVARRSGCKLVYSHYSYYGGILAAAIFRLLGGKALYWNCGELASFRLPWQLRSFFKIVYQELRPRLTFAIVNALVTGTSTMRQYYSKHYDVPLRKIEVMPNWVDLARFNSLDLNKTNARIGLGIEANNPVFLYVHNVSVGRGSDRLIGMMEYLKVKYPRAILLVVGGKGDEALLSRQIEISQMHENIRLVGRVPNSRIHAYFAAADVFFMPSRAEGFPRVLLETMAMGVPFVATDVGGVRDFTSKLQQRFLVSNYTTEKFVECVVEIVDDNYIAQDLRVNGLKVVQDYSLEKVAQEFVCLWNKWLE